VRAAVSPTPADLVNPPEDVRAVKKEEYGQESAGRIPELDGIRGIAIGMVLMHHYFYLAVQARPATALSYALVSGRLMWSGVDLFFVLSGFLIGGILLDSRSSSNYFQVFYTRRFFRIVPIYAICVAGAFALTWLFRLGVAGGLSWIVKDQLPWIPYLVFLQNFWMAHKNTLGLFGLGVTWSLAVEEQFYLTLPSLIRFLSPRRLVAVVVACIIAAPMLRIALYARWPDHPLSWVTLMPCRADALLLGVLGAIAMRDARWRAILASNQTTLRLALAVFAMGVGYLNLRAASPYGPVMVTIGFTWLAAFYLCILVYALTFHGSWIGWCLRWGWLGWLGSIAYGVYLLHEFVRVAFFGIIWSRPPEISSVAELCVTILALAVTLVVCRVSWVYFEKPLIRRGHRARYYWSGAKIANRVGAPSAEASGS
jgi:peptidoglycan/LPS O-acetylase OafA/YrhL